MPEKSRKQAVLWKYAITICIVLLFVYISQVKPKMLDRTGLNSKERNAVALLHSYGEAQLAYHDANREHYWGSWEALSRTGFIEEGYSLPNTIDDYYLWADRRNWDWPLRLDLCGGFPTNSFTLVAFPYRHSPPGYLSTFSIREDQRVRMYDPDLDKCIAWDEKGRRGTMDWPKVVDDKPEEE